MAEAVAAAATTVEASFARMTASAEEATAAMAAAASEQEAAATRLAESETAAAEDVVAADARMTASAEETAATVAASSDEIIASNERMAAAQTTAAEAAVAAQTEVATGAEVSATKVMAAYAEEGAAAEALAAKTEASAGATALAEARLGGLAAKSGATRAEMGALGGTFDSVASKVGMTGGQFGLLALAAAAVTVETSKMAATFDQNMTRLATQAHVPQDQIDVLSQKVLGLAGKVGEDPNSLADAMFHIQSSFAGAGLSAEKATQILTVAAEGARMGGADLVDVTNAMDAAIVSGIPGVQDYNQAMGMLNATVGAGDMKMQDLAEAMGTGVLAVIKGYGVTMRDSAAALAVFGDNNIRGAKAGTQLRMSVQALAVPAKAGVGHLKELGMSADTLAKDMQHGGLNEAMTDLNDHLHKAGITGVKTGQWLTDTFGKRAGAGIAVLMGQYDRFEQKLGEVDKGAKSFADDWTKQQETAAQKTADFHAAIDALGIQMGNVFLPVLTAVVGGLGNVVTWFAQNKAAAEVLAGVVGVVLGGAFLALGAKFAKFALSPLFKVGGGIADFLGWVGRKIFGYKQVGAAAEEDAAVEETAGERAAAAMESAAASMEAAATRIAETLGLPAAAAEETAARVEAADEQMTAAETGKAESLAELGARTRAAWTAEAEAAEATAEKVEAAAKTTETAALNMGEMVGAGAAAGIEEGSAAAAEATTSFAERIIAVFKAIFRIASPSALTAEFGLNLDQGLAQGVEEGAGVVTGAVDALAQEVVAAFEAITAEAAATGEQFDVKLAAGITADAEAAVAAGRATAEAVVLAVDEVAATVRPVVVRTVREGGPGGAVPVPGGGERSPPLREGKKGGAMVGGALLIGGMVAGEAITSATDGGPDPTKDNSFGAAANDAGNTAGMLLSLDIPGIVGKFKRDAAAPQQFRERATIAARSARRDDAGHPASRAGRGPAGHRAGGQGRSGRGEAADQGFFGGVTQDYQHVNDWFSSPDEDSHGSGAGQHVAEHHWPQRDQRHAHGRDRLLEQHGRTVVQDPPCGGEVVCDQPGGG